MRTSSSPPRQSRRAIFEFCVTVLVICTSALFALFVGEFMIRIVRPEVVPGDYPQRFLIDGRPSFVPGYFGEDPVLPAVLRPGYDHVVRDRALLQPFHVALDRYGFRNHIDRSTAEAVFVGDSVLFGYGAEQPDTLSEQLSGLLHMPMYNLGVPGLGPAEYTIMLQRYLAAAPRPRLIVAGFYMGNNQNDLDAASWRELAACSPPTSRIYRTNVPTNTPAYPIWMTTSILKASHLATFLAQVASPPPPSTIQAVVAAHQVAAAAAASTIRTLAPAGLELKDASDRAVQYAAALSELPCVTLSERQTLAAYRDAMQHGRWRAALPAAERLARDLLDRGCDGIAPTLNESVLPNFHFYGVYYWRVINEHKTGDVRAYDQLLSSLAVDERFKEFRGPIRAIRRKLPTMDPSVGSDIDNLNSQFRQHFAGSLYQAPPGCDKMVIFLKELHRLASEQGAQLLLAVIPAEYQLRFLRAHGMSGYGYMCEPATQNRVPCLDVSPRLLTYYGHSAEGLYVDGAHFNARGSALVASWLADWIRGH